MPNRVMYDVRGNDAGVVFQEPMVALNPVQRVGRQIIESLLLHRDLTKAEVSERLNCLMRLVFLPGQAISDYPHQLSGGIAQGDDAIARVATRLADCRRTDHRSRRHRAGSNFELMSEMQMSGAWRPCSSPMTWVIAEQCDEVVVMYAGRIVERASVKDLFAEPKHAHQRSVVLDSTLDQRTQKQAQDDYQAGCFHSDFVAGCRFCQRMGQWRYRSNGLPTKIWEVAAS